MTDDQLLEMLRANSASIPQHPNGPHVYPPATDEQITAAEQELNVEFPALLKRIWREIGNGGPLLGPAYGLFGVTGGFGLRDNLVSLSASFSQGYLWWEQFVVVSEGGCGMFFCMDCGDDDSPFQGAGGRSSSCARSRASP